MMSVRVFATGVSENADLMNVERLAAIRHLDADVPVEIAICPVVSDALLGGVAYRDALLAPDLAKGHRERRGGRSAGERDVGVGLVDEMTAHEERRPFFEGVHVHRARLHRIAAGATISGSGIGISRRC